MKSHVDGTMPPITEVFVFGSNLSGIHGAGAAKAAYEKFGAVRGMGVGRVGRSYAIPTKDFDIETMPLHLIKANVRVFINHAATHPEDTFFVTRIGCGLAGYKDEQIAPMFKDAPGNCNFSESWMPYLEEK